MKVNLNVTADSLQVTAENADEAVGIAVALLGRAVDAQTSGRIDPAFDLYREAKDRPRLADILARATAALNGRIGSPREINYPPGARNHENYSETD